MSIGEELTEKLAYEPVFYIPLGDQYSGSAVGGGHLGRHGVPRNRLDHFYPEYEDRSRKAAGVYRVLNREAV